MGTHWEECTDKRSKVYVMVFAIARRQLVVLAFFTVVASSPNLSTFVNLVQSYGKKLK